MIAMEKESHKYLRALAICIYCAFWVFALVTDYMIVGKLIRTPFYVIAIFYPLISSILLLLSCKKIIDYLTNKFIDIFDNSPR